MDDPLQRFLQCSACNAKFTSQIHHSPMIRHGLIQCFGCTTKSIYSASTGQGFELPIQYRWLIGLLEFSEDPSEWIRHFNNKTRQARQNPFRCPHCSKLYAQDQRGVVISCGHVICEGCHDEKHECPTCSESNADTPKSIPPQGVQDEFNDFMETIQAMAKGKGRGRVKAQPKEKKVAKRPRSVRKCLLPIKKRRVPASATPETLQEDIKNVIHMDLDIPLLDHFFSEENLLDEACFSQSSQPNSSNNESKTEDDEDISIIAVKNCTQKEVVLLSSTPQISPFKQQQVVKPPNLDEAVGTVECSECERVTDTNDVFLCTTCGDKALCSLCMFRFHQKMGHEVRELMQDKLNSLLTSTKEYVNYQCSANIDAIQQEIARVNESFEILPKIFSDSIEQISISSCLETAKSGLYLLSKLSTNLQSHTKDIYPGLRLFNRRLRRMTKELREAFPRRDDPSVDLHHHQMDQPGPSGVIATTRLIPFPVVAIDLENNSEDS